MPRVISLQIEDGEMAKLERLTEQLGRSLEATASLLLDEKLREEEFPFVEFRNSPVGRQAYVQGSRVTVWQVVLLARGYGMDIGQVAKHLDWPE